MKTAISQLKTFYYYETFFHNYSHGLFAVTVGLRAFSRTNAHVPNVRETARCSLSCENFSQLMVDNKPVKVSSPSIIVIVNFKCCNGSRCYQQHPSITLA